MEIEKLIGLILIALALGALITLLFIVMIPMAKEQQKEIKLRNNLYKAATKYLNYRSSMYEGENNEQE